MRPQSSQESEAGDGTSLRSKEDGGVALKLIDFDGFDSRTLAYPDVRWRSPVTAAECGAKACGADEEASLPVAGFRKMQAM